MNEYQALTIVSENNGKSIENMLAAANKAGHKNYAENQERFYSLHQKGYVQGAFVLDLPVSLTLLGKDHLERLQNEVRATKRDKREKWAERIWSFAAGIVATILTQLIINALAG